MPEGDTIFRSARTLNRALAGREVTRFEAQLGHLARVDDESPVAGRVIERVEPTGKWIRMYFSGDLILLTHMLMSGSWHIYRPGEPWKISAAQMRVAVHTQDFVAVGFRIPIAEFHTAASLARHRSMHLGPDVLAKDFDEARAVEQLRSHSNLEVGEALLRQHLIAGMGNVFKSETCFASRVDPFRSVGSLSDLELRSLMSNARRFMQANITDAAGDKITTYFGFRRTTGRSDESERLWVYARRGQPCRRCSRPIVSKKQGADARVTFWCPGCQK